MFKSLLTFFKKYNLLPYSLSKLNVFAGSNIDNLRKKISTQITLFFTIKDYLNLNKIQILNLN